MWKKALDSYCRRLHGFSVVRWRCCIRGSHMLFHSEALTFFRHHCVLLPKVVLFDFCVKCVPFYFFFKHFPDK